MRTRERWEYLIGTPKIALAAVASGRYSFTCDWMPVTVRGMRYRSRWNLLCSGLNLLHRRARPWSWPLHIQIELNSHCNHRYPVCPVGIRDLARGAVVIDVCRFENLMREVGPYLPALSLWAWGEPRSIPN